ncbi:major facilitator superfamily domain-containing protein [Phascolomyces articulosus]|uniref:Major facilitator superfamily domain-containing protein n=1 Tax=Phascolomyces articulosus TaxID=60185 RepID=A0AAD5KKF6_9FUNG|nr:major facilitator superfamily domain-containing protein [Phascolomyces articulosus]
MAEKTAVDSPIKSTYDEKTSHQPENNADTKNLDTESALSGTSSWSLSSILEKQLVRTVISNAKLGGLMTDLSLTESQYLWCLSIFQVGYILLNVPCNIIIRRWRPSAFLAILTLFWGIIAMSTAAVHNFVGLFMARFMMGVAEAGATGGLIAYGITFISTDRLNSWQWMFVIEGSPCILFAVVTYFYLPDNYFKAKFLTDEQKQLQDKRMTIDQGAAGDTSWSWSQVRSIFTDWKIYLYTVIHICTSVAGVGVSLTLPSLINGMGDWGPATSLALTTPPYALSCVLIFIGAYSSDRFFDRSIHLVVGNLLCALGYLLMMFAPTESVAVRYFAVCIALGGNYMVFPIKIAWYSNNFSGLTRRAIAVGVIASVDSIGSAFGTQIYFDGPNYFWGNTIGFICIVVQIIAIIALRFALQYQNKKRDKMTPEEKEQEITKYEPHLIGDRHPDFRYAL